jgi:hypothetical protein
MLYAKKIAVNAVPLPPRDIGPSVVPTSIAALLAAWPAQWPTPNVTTDANGTINIPAAATSFVNRSAAVTVMKSYDLRGEQLVILSGNYADPYASAFSYEVIVPAASTRFLTFVSQPRSPPLKPKTARARSPLTPNSNSLPKTQR